MTIFSEDFGTAATEKDELLENHAWGANPSDMFSWQTATDQDNINVRNNNPSDYVGASANGNLYFKGSASFTIKGITTEGYDDIQLWFGAFGKNADDVKAMTLDCSSDGGATNRVADFADLNLNTAKKTWNKVEGISLPKAASLTLTFSSALDLLADGGIRLDDITVTGTKGTTGIDRATQQPTAVILQGRTLSYAGAAPLAEVYSVSGGKVAQVASGSATTLGVAAGVYVVKAGNHTVKVVVR